MPPSTRVLVAVPITYPTSGLAVAMNALASAQAHVVNAGDYPAATATPVAVAITVFVVVFVFHQ
jgi:hypothetical protein